MLIDREQDLASLEQAWGKAQAGVPQLAVIWGRRRVGKTFTLTHFVKGKPAVFFTATKQAEPIELQRLAEAIRRDLGASVGDLLASFSSWEQALRALIALGQQRELIVVLDEVPYLTRSTLGFGSIVQAVWDHVPDNNRLMLIFTGSAIGVMEDLLSDPLKERTTLERRMDPLDPGKSRLFLPTLSPTAFMEAYAACGGYPLHLQSWDPERSTEANLQELAGESGGRLLESADRILNEEHAEAGYSRILAAIGRGAHKFSEISSQAGQRIEHPLKLLQKTGFVQQAKPLGAPKGADGLYVINDVYLSMWFAVIFADRELIEGGQGEAVLNRSLPRWQTHIEGTFEQVCRWHAIDQVRQGALPAGTVVGRWWATSGEPCEIDVLGLTGNATTVIGEAKWQKASVGRREYFSVMNKLPRTPNPVDEPIVLLYGREVDSAAIQSLAGARGISVDDIFGR